MEAACLYLGFFAGMLWLAGLVYSISWIASHTLPQFQFNHNFKNSLQNIINHVDTPKWKEVQPFWTPIRISIDDPENPSITFCKLDFKTYGESPNSYPMFRDLVLMSKCGIGNSKTARLSEVKSDPNFQGIGGRYMDPKGFVFHESRVGSTLVANALGMIPS